jgi:hypothetical protein
VTPRRPHPRPVRPASGSLVAALTVRISREEAARALAESKAVAV